MKDHIIVPDGPALCGNEWACGPSPCKRCHAKLRRILQAAWVVVEERNIGHPLKHPVDALEKALTGTQVFMTEEEAGS